MEKYQNKYRIPSSRLQSWDYGWAGAYFITICTNDREHFFGKIQNEKMELSNIGILADVFLYEIKNHSKNVELGEFVVMPNHIHLILILNDKNVATKTMDSNGQIGETGEPVETRHALSLQPPPHPQSIGKNRFQNQGKNTVSSIIGSYKSAVTKHAHRLGFKFQWQTRFHDHIIRDEESFNRISEYIINNPKKWEKDKFYENNIRKNI